MYALIGLGNPGSQYERTRHNAGFWAIERLAARLGVAPRAWQQKGGALFCRTTVRCERGDEELLLIEPQQYMNRSGQSARPLLAFFKVPPSRTIVLHDELDIPPGELRLKIGGSSGGHRGVNDLAAQLGTKEFYRIRIGIGHPRRAGGDDAMPGDSGHSEQDVAAWVLGVPKQSELELIEAAADDAGAATELLIAEGLQAAQQRFHGKKPKSAP